MGTFQGTFNAGVKENHLFSTENPQLISIGLSEFTINSFDKIRKEFYPAANVVYPSLSPPKDGDFVTSVLPESQIFYKPYKNQTYTLEPLSSSEVIELINYYEKKQKSPSNAFTKESRFEEILSAIPKSLSKAIIINSNLQSIGLTNVSAKIYLRFFKTGEQNNDRVMAMSQPMITAPATTPAGSAYSLSATSSLSSDTGEIGIVVAAQSDDQNKPANNAVGRLDVTYNQVNGKFESGTKQMLAKLLQDIPPAPITNAIPDPSDTTNTSNYDRSSSSRTGGFTSGLAAPLTMQNGNPDMYGPNIIQCGDRSMEQVVAVNRSAVNFRAGEVVMLNYISSEWIISSLGQATLSAPGVRVSDWSFAKYIVNSDSFFKDKNFYDSEDEWDKYNRSITPNIYETYKKSLVHSEGIFKAIFQDIFTKYYPSPSFESIILANYTEPPFNLSDISFIPSKEYYSTTIFDHLYKENGGFLSADIKRLAGQNEPVIKTINIRDPSLQRDSAFENIFPFWGPVFSDGYKSLAQGFNEIITQDDNIYFNRKIGDADVSLPSNDRLNIPAEITSKIINVEAVKRDHGKIGIFNSNEARIKYCFPPFYKSVPLSTNKIQFIPLGDTLVGHLDTYSALAKTLYKGRDYYTSVRQLFNLEATGNLFGDKFFARNNTFLLPSFDILKTDPCFFNYYETIGPLPASSPLTFDEVKQIAKGAYIPYGCYTKRPLITNKGLGSPKYFPSEGAKAVGITVGKCKLGKSGGGDINFSVSQSFGLTMERQVTQQPGSFLFIPLGGGVAWGSAGSVTEFAFEMWGSTEDNIDSLGTTALHVRIFDSWPEDQMFFDPRYFAVLHFNPCGKGTTNNDPLLTEDNTIDNNKVEKLGSLAKFELKGLKGEEIAEKYGARTQDINSLPLGYIGYRPQQGRPFLPYYERPRYVHVQETSVDLRIPTIDDQRGRTLGTNQLSLGLVAPPGTVIHPPNTIDGKFYEGTILRPVEEWMINPIRRGQLLTGTDGFIYKYSVIGINPNNFAISKAGKGYKANDKFDLAKGVSVIIIPNNDDGGIQGLTFAKSTDLSTTIYNKMLKMTGDNQNPLNPLRLLIEASAAYGENFLPSDFSQTSSINGEQRKCFKITLPTPPNGEAAELEFYSGLVWEKWAQDLPPKEHAYLTRLTSNSKLGQNNVEESITNTINVERNNNGQYDAFFFFHNDISHTAATPRPANQIPGFMQYVDLTIT